MNAKKAKWIRKYMRENVQEAEVPIVYHKLKNGQAVLGKCERRAYKVFKLIAKNAGRQ